jgi:hypothetical protein
VFSEAIPFCGILRLIVALGHDGGDAKVFFLDDLPQKEKARFMKKRVSWRKRA